MGEFAVYFVLALIVVGFIGSGIAWLFIHALPWVILFFVVVFIIVVACIWSLWPRKSVDVALLTREAREAARIGNEARSAMATLVAERPAVIKKARELERLRDHYAGETNFHILTTKHFESLKLGDSWYNHKRQASATHRKLLNGVRRLESHIKRIEGTSRRSSELSTAKQSTSSLKTIVRELSTELDRSTTELTRYNQQTAHLRDHIHTHCGERGRRWYAELEERKRQRSARGSN